MPPFSNYLKLVVLSGVVFSILLIPFGLIYAVVTNGQGGLWLLFSELVSGLLMAASISLFFLLSAVVSYHPLKYLVRKGVVHFDWRNPD